MKACGMSLQDIKKLIKQENEYEEIDLHEIRLHMQTLKKKFPVY